MYDVHFEIDFLVSFLFILKYYILDLIKTCQSFSHTHTDRVIVYLSANENDLYIL